VLAGLRAEQGASEEALALLRKSIACWLPAEPAADADAADADEDEMLGDGALSEPPSFEFRVVTAKMLIDLDDSTETAVRVLEVCSAPAFVIALCTCYLAPMQPTAPAGCLAATARFSPMRRIRCSLALLLRAGAA
jgi:hypothetical protein